MEQIPFMGYYIRLLIMMNKFFDYMLLIFLILVMILDDQCVM